jgi:peptidoglycan/xylan/chitin deacetylase (PgdA/CDA1 family)
MEQARTAYVARTHDSTPEKILKEVASMFPGSLIRKATKAAVLPLGVGARRRSGDVVMLLYHRVGVGDREIDLPLGAFERQLATLKKRAEVLTLDDAFDGGDGGVIVTFDDGYRDFYEHVLPLLVRYGIPAVLYLATGLVNGGETRSHPRSDDSLTWSQLREAVGTGLVICGSHTHGHSDLARASEKEAEEEMRRSQELIEDQLGMACRHFAYPWAVGSDAADRAARRLFDTAALLPWKTNRRGRTDLHRLGRVPVLRSDGQLFFRAKLLGLLEREALVYRALGRGPWSRM